MKNVVSVLKEADMAKVIGLHLANTSGRLKISFDRWFSLYCHMVESCFPEADRKVVITKYDRNGIVDGIPQYAFHGVSGSDIDRKTETPIIWEEVLTGQIDLMIPECILNKLDHTYLAFTILECMDHTYGVKPTIRKNYKLYKRASSYAGRIKNENRVESLHKGIEKIFATDVRSGELRNEILELYELKHIVLTWDRVLRFEGDYEREFQHLSGDNPVSYERARERQTHLWEKYKELDMDHYMKNGLGNPRIIIEAQGGKSAVPLVYVHDNNGKNQLLSEVDEQEFLCMDIRVVDENINELKQILAILMMYLEYPIRTKRMLSLKQRCYNNIHKKRDEVIIC